MFFLNPCIHHRNAYTDCLVIVIQSNQKTNRDWFPRPGAMTKIPSSQEIAQRLLLKQPNDIECYSKLRSPMSEFFMCVQPIPKIGVNWDHHAVSGNGPCMTLLTIVTSYSMTQIQTIPIQIPKLQTMSPLKNPSYPGPSTATDCNTSCNREVHL